MQSKDVKTEDYSLLFGDCLERMKEIPNGSVDLILTDPPYGTTRCRWDSVINFDTMWKEVWRVLKPNGACLLFAQTPFDKVLGASNIQDLKYEWVWEKTQATGHLNAKKMPMKAHENILVFYKQLPKYTPIKTTGHKPVNSYTKYVSTQNNTELYGKMTKELSGGGETERYPRSVLIFPSDKQKVCLHPTQKPVALLEYLINTYTSDCETVLDFTMGSASTGIACLNTNRKFIGIEMEEKYFSISVNRMKEVEEEQHAE